MPGINIYVPEELHVRIKRSGIEVSQVCRRALELALNDGSVPEKELILGSPEDVAEAIMDAGHRLNTELKRLGNLVKDTWHE